MFLQNTFQTCGTTFGSITSRILFIQSYIKNIKHILSLSRMWILLSSVHGSGKALPLHVPGNLYATQVEQSGTQIDHLDQIFNPFAPGNLLWPRDDEGYSRGNVIESRLLVQVVIGKMGSMIRKEHNDRVVRIRRFCKGIEDSADFLIHKRCQPVIARPSLANLL